MFEPLANEYVSESTGRGLSNEYQHDRVLMVFKYRCVLVLWMKVASALEGLSNLNTAYVNRYMIFYLRQQSMGKLF